MSWLYLSQIFLIALHFLLWKEKPKNYLNEGLFPLHEATKLAILVFLAKKTTNSQKKIRKTRNLEHTA